MQQQVEERMRIFEVELAKRFEAQQKECKAILVKELAL
jgi:hypothetical protein